MSKNPMEKMPPAGKSPEKKDEQKEQLETLSEEKKEKMENINKLQKLISEFLKKGEGFLCPECKGNKTLTSYSNDGPYGSDTIVKCFVCDGDGIVKSEPQVDEANIVLAGSTKKAFIDIYVIPQEGDKKEGGMKLPWKSLFVIEESDLLGAKVFSFLQSAGGAIGKVKRKGIFDD